MLVEYSVIGGKFTSVVNNLEQVKETVQEMQGGGEMTDRGRPQVDKKGKKQGTKKEKGYIEEEKGDFTCTIEYTDSRQRKLRGDQRFEGKIIYDSTKADARVNEEYEYWERLEREKDHEIALLEDLIKRFDIKLFKQKIENRIEKTLDTVEMDKVMT